jgi:hypothetical protein
MSRYLTPEFSHSESRLSPWSVVDPMWLKLPRMEETQNWKFAMQLDLTVPLAGGRLIGIHRNIN